MSTRTTFIAKLVGFYLLFFGIYLLTQPHSSISTLTDLVQRPSSLLICAVLAMTAGLAIVLNHNVWRGGALPILVTLIGWLALAKGLILLLLPPAAQLSYWQALRFPQLFYVYDAVILVLAAYLLIASFTAGTLP